MAVDEVLRRSHAEQHAPPTLRFYEWSCPTLSLGAGQHLPAALTAERLAALQVSVVRRPTGGRAVLHGGDLTYAIVAGRREGFPPSVTGVYRCLRAGLQRGLANLGIDTTSPAGTPPAGFSCFAQAARGDLAWQGQSFLQHGAILLQPQRELWHRILRPLGQEVTLPITSLQEILGAAPPVALVKAALRRGWEEELGIRFTAAGLTPWEQELLHRDYGFTPDRVATILSGDQDTA